MSSVPLPIHGRGAGGNPPNRFEPIAFERDPDACIDPADDPALTTQYFKDSTRSIIAENDSPDVGFRFSINPYRGCEHGCIYCYARPTHEYLGLSAGLDFESRIFVKTDAPQLLRKELMAKKWSPQTISISGVTDCYQPAERHFKLTRQCLEVLAEFGNPAGIVTKSHLVTRDIDVLQKLAAINAIIVMLSVTTLDGDVSRKMEPRAASPERRLEAIRQLTAAGIAVGVMVAPVVPGLTDHEIPTILAAAASAGAVTAGYVPLRLPYAVAPLFEQWVQTHFPDRAGKILNRIKDLRGGKLNDANFHTRMRGQGQFAEHMKSIFDLAKRKASLDKPFPDLATCHFTRPGSQLTMF